MLPQFGLTEFMLVAIVALIVVGPKDLPMMMRKLGQFVAKGRAMAREFQSAFDDIARQGELDELRKEIEDLRRDNALTGAVDDFKKAERDINRRVMMENPLPGNQTGPGAISDTTEEASEDTSAEAPESGAPVTPAPVPPAHSAPAEGAASGDKAPAKTGDKKATST
ncbi:Sec-independent protein translocase protein TatB [Henriciella marina]|uniref:Sec-independent protein translocase protein TatB n=1 Tax=Henriciella marina TaxID=453851 RepID=UPI0003798499|nr:Sec-independent protein translocase protein TatB [Henriciella marina]